MRAKYSPKETTVRLDRNEAVLVIRALDCLRYAPESANWNGDQLLELAALSHTWRAMVQDMNSPAAEERCRIHNDVEALAEIAATKPSPEEALNITWEEAQDAEVH